MTAPGAVVSPEDLEARLVFLAGLSRGWLDGFFGDPISPVALLKARQVASAVLDRGVFVYPVADGGVQVVWDGAVAGCELRWEVAVSSQGWCELSGDVVEPDRSACVGGQVSSARRPPPMTLRWDRLDETSVLFAHVAQFERDVAAQLTCPL